jgi:hypothetical protein
MSDKLSLEQAIADEEARLRERLSDLAEFRRLAIKLNIAVPGLGLPSPSLSAQQPVTPFETSPRKAFLHSSAALAPPSAAFDGTFAGLISSYRTHQSSPYHQLKHNVRISYDGTLDRLLEEIGKERLEDWNASVIQSHYDENWAAGGGKISAGHNIIGKLRLLCSFGSVVLNDESCTRLSTILGNMRFQVARVRTEVLTRDHARAIRAAAHEQFGWPSIALAQAFQFDIPRLKQVGVIGEWVPLSEPGTSEITKGNEKWVRGLRWSDIDENMILRKVLRIGRQNQPKEFAFNLSRAAMVMEEINRVPPAKRVGPMIICEFSGLPWTTSEFRRKWRKVADRVGVPPNVKNMDTARADIEANEENSEDLPYMK